MLLRLFFPFGIGINAINPSRPAARSRVVNCPETVSRLLTNAARRNLHFTLNHYTLTVHSLRKSCGQNWANHLPINVVKEFMGHSDIKTTAEFYTEVRDDHSATARWVIEAITVKSGRETDARLTPEAKSGLERRVG